MHPPSALSVRWGMFLFGCVGIAFARKEDNVRESIDSPLRSVGRSIEMFHLFCTAVACYVEHCSI